MGVLSRLLRGGLRSGQHRRGAVHAAQALTAAAALACASWSGPVWAGPEALAHDWLPGGQAAGSARLRFWGFDVYDASLAVGPGFQASSFASHPFALELAYLRPFRATDIARRSLQEMRRAAPLDPAVAQRWQKALQDLLPDVQTGDRLVGVHRPGRGALFILNGRTLGEIADARFSAQFFAIWLGPATSEPALRQALLAGAAP